MTDAWGWRMKFGVVTPSTNTMVQPHFDAMRPPGVTNHIARMHIPDEPIESDDDFDALIRRIDDALEESVDRVMTCRPDHLILGISAESIWGGGMAPARKIESRIKQRAGTDIGVTQAADALPAALAAFRHRQFRCPECGAEKTVAETAHDDEVESLENEGESAWGKDEGPWEG